MSLAFERIFWLTLVVTAFVLASLSYPIQGTFVLAIWAVWRISRSLDLIVEEVRATSSAHIGVEEDRWANLRDLAKRLDEEAEREEAEAIEEVRRRKGRMN